MGSKIVEDTLPTQLQAARSLIGWTQEKLAKESGVSLSSIRDFESGRRDGSVDNVQALRETLERTGGVLFLAEDDGGGPGVRLARERATLTKAPTKVLFENDTLPFTVQWRGRDVFVFLSREAIEDLAEARQSLSDKECVSIFAKWRDRILTVTTRAIYSGLVDDRGRLWLRSKDFQRRQRTKR